MKTMTSALISACIAFAAGGAAAQDAMKKGDAMPMQKDPRVMLVQHFDGPDVGGESCRVGLRNDLQLITGVDFRHVAGD